MTPKVKRLFIMVIALQVVLLLSLVGYRESILIMGRTAVLQTVPVDPRDLFRGEYVVLRYDITTLGQDSNTPGAKRYNLRGEINEGDTVYVTLTNGNGNPYYMEVQAGEPTDDADLFLKGRVTQKRGDMITVEYGIEQYFVPEGRGLEIERADDVKVKVKINRSGTAAIEELIVDGKTWKP